MTRTLYDMSYNFYYRVKITPSIVYKSINYLNDIP